MPSDNMKEAIGKVARELDEISRAARDRSLGVRDVVELLDAGLELAEALELAETLRDINQVPPHFVAWFKRKVLELLRPARPGKQQPAS